VLQDDFKKLGRKSRKLSNVNWLSGANSSCCAPSLDALGNLGANIGFNVLFGLLSNAFSKIWCPCDNKDDIKIGDCANIANALAASGCGYLDQCLANVAADNVDHSKWANFGINSLGGFCLVVSTHAS
jgi:hypothetical protein